MDASSPTARLGMSLRIVIPGEPFAQPRARAAVINGHARIYDPRVAKNWKATAQQHMREAVPVDFAGGVRMVPFVMDGPVELRVTAFFTCPKTDHRKREPRGRRWHTKKPDADNVLKAVKDAAKGVLWQDDSQVSDERARKVIAAQGEAPRVEIEVRALAEYAEREPRSRPPDAPPDVARQQWEEGGVDGEQP